MPEPADPVGRRVRPERARSPARSAHRDTFTRDNLPPRHEWPEFIFELPELQYPERLNCAEVLLDAHVAAGRGARRAVGMLVDGMPRFASYRQLQAQANRIAGFLLGELGLVPGERVLLRSPNNAMLAAAWLGIMKAGLVAVPTMPLLRAKELRQIIEKARISTALCDATLAQELEYCRDMAHPSHCPELATVVYFNDARGAGLEARLARHPDHFENVATAADDVCLLAFTSGTTGVPKATMHAHRDVLAMCDTFARHILCPDADDLFCGTPPLAFTFGLGGLLCFALHAGAATLLIERLTPDGLLAAIERARATIVFTAPTFYRQMAHLIAAAPGAYDITSLQKSVSAGEALPDATRSLWRSATGIEMIDGIGGTEVMHIYISAAGKDVRRGAIGKVVPGFRAAVVGPDLRPLPPGQVGRLALKGPTGCRYLADPRQREYVQGGWNLPGDAFMMDDDGYFYYQARTDDMIVSAGYNIAGPEVEGALLAHPAVAECGVVGVADAERGQLVKAFVVLKPGFTPGEALSGALQDHVKATIAPYKYPRVIEYCSTLPRTETGKLQRFKLRTADGTPVESA